MRIFLLALCLVACLLFGICLEASEPHEAGVNLPSVLKSRCPCGCGSAVCRCHGDCLNVGIFPLRAERTETGDCPGGVCHAPQAPQEALGISVEVGGGRGVRVAAGPVRRGLFGNGPLRMMFGGRCRGGNCQ